MPDDMYEIEEYFKNNNVCFIEQPSKKEEISFIDTILFKKDQFSHVYLTEFRFQNEIYKEYIKKQEYYLVRILESFAIEFDRGGFLYNKDRLERARLYFVTGYYNDGGSLVRKDEEFIQWADQIYKGFKKKFLIKSDLRKGILFSRKALSWIIESGAEISPSTLEVIVNKNSR